MRGLGYDEENWESRPDFYKEIKFLAKHYGVKESTIEIDCTHPTGEICIFFKKEDKIVWMGYIDKWFYNWMECGDEYAYEEYFKNKWQ